MFEDKLTAGYVEQSTISAPPLDMLQKYHDIVHLHKRIKKKIEKKHVSSLSDRFMQGDTLNNA